MRKIFSALTFAVFTLSLQAEEFAAFEHLRSIEYSYFDCTPELQEKIDEPNLEERLEDLFQGSRALLIRGFLSDYAQSESSRRIGKWFKIKRQFQDQIDVLDSLNVDWELLDIESEEAPDYNAAIIREALVNAAEPLIIITHSKGGIDLLHLLIEEPELGQKIKFWIPMQAPFFGTPAADWGVRKAFNRRGMTFLLDWSGGSIRSLESLSVAERSNSMFEHQDKIAEIVEQVPILGLAAWKPEIEGSWDTPFEPFFRDWLLKRGLENDGIVPLRSAKIPGARFVQIDGMDHLWRTSIVGFDGVDGKAIMLGLLALAYEQPHCTIRGQQDEPFSLGRFRLLSKTDRENDTVN